MTPLRAVAITAAVSALALITVCVVSAIPVDPPQLVEVSVVEASDSDVTFGLANDGLGRRCAANVTIVSEGATLDDITNLRPEATCTVPRKQWFQILGEVAAVTFGPFFVLFVLIVRWLMDRSRRGVENPGRRRLSVELSLAIVGLVLVIMTFDDQVIVLVNRGELGWVSSYGSPSWVNQFLSYVSNIGLGLFLGAVIGFCSEWIETRLEATLNNPGASRRGPATK